MAEISEKKALSLHFSILIPLILLFLAVATVSAWLFFKSSRDSIDSQVAVYQKMILENTKLKLENFLEKPHLMNASVRNTLKRNPGLYGDLPQMRRIFLDNLSIYPSVMAGALGVENSGNFISAGRHIKGGFDSAVYQKEVSSRYNYYKLDEKGLPGELIASRDGYDLKARPWYKTAIQAGKPTWSAIYTFAANTEIGLTAVLPVYRNGRPAGVIQSAFSLAFIAGFLRELPMKGNHRIFIFENSGFLVGASGNTRVVVRDTEGKLRRVGLNDVRDPIIEAAYLSGALNRALEGGKTVHFMEGGENYYLRTIIFSGDFDLEWTVAIADIREDFTEGLETVFKHNLLISALAALLCMAFGVMILRKMIVPLSRLSRAVKIFTSDHNMAKFRIEGPGEIRELSRGFSIMAKEIRLMVSNLETRVTEKTGELEESLEKVKTLTGLLPICSKCKKIRDDKGYWNKIETYIERHTDALFNHGMCSECAEKIYGDQEWYKKMKKE